MNAFGWSGLLITVTCLLLAGFTLIFGPKRDVDRLWVLFNICVSGWGLGAWGVAMSTSEASAIFWWKVAFVGGFFLGVTFFHLVRAFYERTKPWPLISCYLYGCIAGWLCMSGAAVPRVKFDFKSIYYNQANLLMTILVLTWIGIVVSSFHVGIRAHSQLEGNKSMQSKYLLLSLGLGFIGGTSVLLPMFGIPLYPYGNFTIPLYCGVATYAVLKHNLMDITVVIRKSVIYSILVALITAIYLVFVLITEKFLQGALGYKAWAPSLLAAFAIAIGFTPLKNWIQSFVDRHFFRGTQAAMAAENDRLRAEVEHSEKLKAISLFASGMAHEIKNPLASLKTFAEFLPAKYDDPAFRAKFTRIVGHEVGRIQDIVQQLLTFAKPAPPNLQAIQASKVLDETLDFLQSELVRKQLRLTRSYVTPDTITADPAQLKQVFLNLLLNAIEATPAGGTITATTIPNGRYLTITIADTGCGMNAQQLARMGEPFFTTKPNGTGLGLAVVHGILEQHHGSLKMVSHPDQGIQAQIRLPLARTPEMMS